MMDHTPGDRPDRELVFLQELTLARIAGDVVEVARGTWAIYGDIPVDRDVIMAEFATYDDARTALDAFFRRTAGTAPGLIDHPATVP
jgi:hypothetical protein